MAYRDTRSGAKKQKAYKQVDGIRFQSFLGFKNKTERKKSAKRQNLLFVVLKEKKPYEQILINEGLEKDDIISLDEFSQTIAGKSVVLPNFSTFFTGIFRIVRARVRALAI